jgi:hypothetical protein
LKLGSDHRGVKIILDIHGVDAKKVRRGGTSKVGWSPSDLTVYHQRLDTHIDDIFTGLELDRRTSTLDDNFGSLNKFIAETACICSKVDRRVESSQRLCDETISMIRRRQELVEDDCNKEVRREASKLIQAMITKDLRAWRQRTIAMKLDSFTDLKSIGGIRRNGKKSNLVCVKNKDGVRESSRQGIADVFATFYEDLYQPILKNEFDFGSMDVSREVPEVTVKEIEDCLQKIAKKKSPDKAGIVVEILQNRSANLCSVIAKLFTDVMKGEKTPDLWKHLS